PAGNRRSVSIRRLPERRRSEALRRAAPWGRAGRRPSRAHGLFPPVFRFPGPFAGGGLVAPGPRAGRAAHPVARRGPHGRPQRPRAVREKRPEPLPPASVTKVFTLVVALEALRDGRVALDALVVTSARAAGMGGTQVYLEVGELMTLEDLLYGIAVESANDAAVAVAEHISGSEEAFAALINERSRALGARNTDFSNASGLPPEDLGMAGRRHVTSAYDVALISRYGYTLPMFEQLVSTYGPYR